MRPIFLEGCFHIEAELRLRKRCFYFLFVGHTIEHINRYFYRNSTHLSPNGRGPAQQIILKVKLILFEKELVDKVNGFVVLGIIQSQIIQLIQNDFLFVLWRNNQVVCLLHFLDIYWHSTQYLVR